MQDQCAMHVWVEGRVQGVGYRFSARDEAHRLGLTGWVRNLPDGRVELLAEGRRAVLESFLAWCRQGPSWAHVTGCEVRFTDPERKWDCFSIVV